MMRRKKMTITKRVYRKTHNEVLDYIIEYIKEHQYAPSNREIQAGVNYKSVETVTRALNQLERDGFIKRTPNIPRSIIVLKGE